MPRLTISNFAAGIKGSPGFEAAFRNVAASDMRNLSVNENGQLIRRSGRIRKPSGAAALSESILRVIPTVFADGGSPIYNLFLHVQRDTNPLLYWNGTTFANVSITPTIPGGNTSQRFDWSVAGNRLFLANGSVPLWVEICQLPTGTAPQAYYWGVEPTGEKNSLTGFTPSAMPNITLAAAGSGERLVAGKYAYAFTYYSDPSTTLNGSQNGTGAESRGSTVSAASFAPEETHFHIGLVDVADEERVTITGMTEHTDEQVTHKRIYRTDPQDSYADASTANLKLIATITNATTSYIDTGLQDLGVVLEQPIHIAEPDEQIGSNPPASLDKITGYAGRIWGSQENTSTMVFSTIDSVGAPMYDTFPDSNAVVPQRFFVNKGDGDVITALEPSASGQELQIFKQHSLVMLRGTGLFTGESSGGGIQSVTVTGQTMSTGATAVDLDLSFTNRTAGCISPLSVATLQDKTFFLADDRQVWVSVSGQMTPVSLAIQPLLNQIPDYVFSTVTGTGQNSDRNAPVVGWAFNNQYHMAFPIESITSGLTRSNVIAVYDLLRQYWKVYDIKTSSDTADTGIQDVAYAPVGESTYDLNNDAVYMAVRDTTSNWYVEEFLTGTQDNGTDFTASYTTNSIQMPSDSVLNGVYVYSTSAVNPALSVNVAVDGQSFTGSGASFTPAKTNRYRLGTFKRGRMFQVKVDGTAMDNIERLELEYQTMGR